MRLATLRTGAGPGRPATVAVRVDGERLVEIPGVPDLGSLLAHEDWRVRAQRAEGPVHAAVGADLAPVVPRPGKILCAGLNYAGHIREMGRELPPYPTLFAKFADTLTGPADPVAAVPEDPQMDWEGELAVVVGREAYRVDAAGAQRYIAGYTVANDISLRGWQNRTTEWLQGKIWARTTPVGPHLVTPEEFDIPSAVLRTTLNGQTVQDHPLADLLFTPAHLLAYISTMIPLQPGDLLLTGTPGGVGHARTPRVHLKKDDEVKVTITTLGSVTTKIV
jgi:acylpyruvate hydrolase